ncbi:MAG: VWA domain-containing protein [Vicinamibacterales bacterium]
MTRLGLPLALVALALAARPGAQQPAAPPPDQDPVFRAGVEVLPLDVTVLDRDGRQVTDLTSADFQVEVDGKPRRIATSEYIKMTDALEAGLAPRGPAPVVPVKTEPPPDYGITSNGGSKGPVGRAILLIVDQGNIRFGAVRPVMQSALKFLDRLQPGDRVGLVAVPAPGETVDFTTDRMKLREAMLRVSGSMVPQSRRFNISITEAFALYRQSDAMLIQQVIARECATVFGAADLERCERDVEQEAAGIVGDLRHQTDRSVSSIRAVLQSLGAMDGPKSVLLISEGLVLESLGGELEDLADVAAQVHASLDVMLLDVAPFDAAQSQMPTTAGPDRRLQEEGLIMLAGMARGTLHRVVSGADVPFRRVEEALAGYYLLGVEPTPGDRDGKRHRIEVKTLRRGLTVRARRTFLSPEGPPAATPVEALKRTLRSALPATALPMRVTTWTYKEPGTSRVRLVVATEVEREADEPLTYAAGVVVATQDGKVIAATEGSRDLQTVEGDDTLASLATILTLDPGNYRLRVALANEEKRVGSVEREVQAWAMDGDALALGDLIVAPEPRGTEGVAPVVEPRIYDGRLVALAEAYAPAASQAAVTARLDIQRDEASSVLLSQTLPVTEGSSPEVRVAQGRVDVAAVPPGSYIAKVTFTENGVSRGALIRPFKVVPTTRIAAADGGAIATPAELHAAVTGSLPAVSKDDLLDAATMSALWQAVEQGRTPGVLAAIKTARGGQMTDGALEALSAGDQSVAAFVRGMDFFAKAQYDRASTQFETAMRLQGSFAVARAMLGACLLMQQREKDAAGLLMAVPAGTFPAFGRLAAETWIRNGQPRAAVAPLEQAAGATAGDGRTTRDLALAYALAGDAAKALPLLTRYLSGPGAKDGPALATGVFALYQRHAAGTDAASIAGDRTQARAWARAYALTRGSLAPIVNAWAAHLESAQ